MTAIPSFPRIDLGRESVPLFRCANGHYLKKEFPQAFGVGSLGAPPATGGPLPLNMHQTALENNPRPPAAEQLVQMRVAVPRSTLRRKPAAGEGGTKRPQPRWPLRSSVGTIYQFVAPRLHRREDSLAPSEAGPVQNQIPMPRKVPSLFGWVLQPIPDDPANGRNAVTTVTRYLPQGVTLHHPALKPDLLLKMLVGRVLPAKRTTATPAKPTLPMVAAFSVSPDPQRPTPNTMLFLSYPTQSLNRFNNSIRIPFQQNNLTPISSIPFEHYARNDKVENAGHHLSFRTRSLPEPKLGFGQGEIRVEQGKRHRPTLPRFIAPKNG